MKIATVVPELVRGGGEKLARQLHQFFIDRGHEARLFSLSKATAGDAALSSLGGVHPKDPRAIMALRAELRRFKPDIVHSHMMPAQLAVRVVSSGAPWRVITTEHSTFNRRRGTRWGFAFDRWLYRGSNAICCISRGVQSAFCEWMPEYAARVRQVNNGINVDRFAFNGTPPRSLRLVSVGRLEKVKGIETALRALAACKDSVSFTYTIFGEGALKRELQSVAVKLEISRLVTFAGWSERLHSELSGYSAFLMPSYWEGFGLAAVEAMAAGVPVIGSNVDGLNEVIGDAGYTFPAGDSESLSKIIRYYNQLGADEIVSLRRGARQRASQFDIKNTVDGYLEIYREI